MIKAALFNNPMPFNGWTNKLIVAHPYNGILSITSHWVSSDFWPPYELMTEWPLLWSQSIPYLVFVFSCCLLFFPRIAVFSIESCLLMMCPIRDNFCFVIFAFNNVSGLICSRAHFVPPSGGPGYPRSFPPTW